MELGVLKNCVNPAIKMSTTTVQYVAKDGAVLNPQIQNKMLLPLSPNKTHMIAPNNALIDIPVAFTTDKPVYGVAGKCGNDPIFILNPFLFEKSSKSVSSLNFQVGKFVR